jgi:hypothetical protein
MTPWYAKMCTLAIGVAYLGSQCVAMGVVVVGKSMACLEVLELTSIQVVTGALSRVFGGQRYCT